MAVISKEAMRLSALPMASCSAINHPCTESCLQGVFAITKNSCVGCVKYMLPIYLLSTLIKYKQWSREYLLLQLHSYLRTTLVGCWMGYSFNHVNCILRRILGEFTYYTISFIPALCGGFGVFIEHPKRRPIVINAYTNWLIQAVLASLYNRRIMPKSLILETLLFMTSNAYLMYQLQQTPSQLWVFKPPPVQQDSKACTHEGECHVDIIKGYMTYLGFGILFDLIRTLLSNSSHILSRPRTLLSLLLSRKLLRLGNFLGCYVAIYKIVCCSLRHMLERNDPRYSILAGFLAGQAYLLLPQHSYLAPTLNQAIQTFYRKTELKPSFLSKVPVGELMFALSNAYLFHLRVVDPASCPSLFKRMMNVCSSGNSDEVYKRYKYFLDQRQ